MLHSIQTHAQRALDNASLITYGSSTSAIVFWGWHISDIGVIISSIASICGVALQAYVALRNNRRYKGDKETTPHDKKAP